MMQSLALGIPTQTPAPDSWGAMFDTRYQHRTAYVIEDFLHLAS
jgi:hypothetical protein